MPGLDDVNPDEVSFPDDADDAAPVADPDAEAQVDEDNRSDDDSEFPLAEDDPNKAW